VNADLSIDELGWLLGLATARRKKREQSLENARRKSGQTPAEFEHGRLQIVRGLNWARSVEDHLILILGDADQARLREHQRDRYRQLKTKAA
jgi:hypothetical protein